MASPQSTLPTPETYWQTLRLSEIAALFIGFLYVSGYFINSIFIRNLGITDTELFRLEYIKIGFTFTLLTLGIVLLPFGAFYLCYRVRGWSQLPHYHAGAIGNALNTTLCLGFPLFLAFFVTKYEFELLLPQSVFGLKSFKSVITTFVPLALTGMIVVPAFERIINRRSKSPLRNRLYQFVVEPIRFGIFIFLSILIIRSLSQIPWIGSLFSRGVYFILAGIIFVGGMSAAVYWVRYIRAARGVWPVYGLIGFGLCSLYYLAVTSYVFGVYNYIPSNRGGRLPVTRAHLQINPDEQLVAEQRVIGSVKVWGPVYIIEDQQEILFVASEKMDRWLFDFVPIHAIRKDRIPYMYIERIENGFPRVPTGP